MKIRKESLEKIIRYKETYLESVKSVLNGNTPIQRDTTMLDLPKTDISNE